jgi:hypothetical protein
MFLVHNAGLNFARTARTNYDHATSDRPESIGLDRIGPLSPRFDPVRPAIDQARFHSPDFSLGLNVGGRMSPNIDLPRFIGLGVREGGDKLI